MFNRLSWLVPELSGITNLDFALKTIDSYINKYGVIRSDYVKKAHSYLIQPSISTATPSSLPQISSKQPFEHIIQRLIFCSSDIQFDESPKNRIEQANQVWRLYTKNGTSLPRHVDLYNTLLETYNANGHDFEPTDFLANMKSAGVTPDQATLTNVLVNYSRAVGKNREAMKEMKLILDYMREQKMTISKKALNALLVAYTNEGSTVEVTNLLTMMEKSASTPDATTYIDMLGAQLNKTFDPFQRGTPSGDPNAHPVVLAALRVLNHVRTKRLKTPPLKLFHTLLPFCDASFSQEASSLPLIQLLNHELTSQGHSQRLISLAARVTMSQLVARGHVMAAAHLLRYVVLPSFMSAVIPQSFEHEGHVDGEIPAASPAGSVPSNNAPSGSTASPVQDHGQPAAMPVLSSSLPDAPVTPGSVSRVSTRAYSTAADTPLGSGEPSSSGPSSKAATSNAGAYDNGDELRQRKITEELDLAAGVVSDFSYSRKIPKSPPPRLSLDHERNKAVSKVLYSFFFSMIRHKTPEGGLRDAFWTLRWQGDYNLYMPSTHWPDLKNMLIEKKARGVENASKRPPRGSGSYPLGRSPAQGATNLLTNGAPQDPFAEMAPAILSRHKYAQMLNSAIDEIRTYIPSEYDYEYANRVKAFCTQFQPAVNTHQPSSFHLPDSWTR